MRWVLISLANAVSISVVSASLDSVPKAALRLHPRASLFGSGKIENATADPLTERSNKTSTLSSRSLSYLFPRQQAGRCGAEFGNQRCGGNQCCSSFGYCGTEFEHCGLIVGCQPDFGRCGDAAPEPSPTTTSSSSSTSRPSPTSLPPTSSSALPPLPSGTLIPSTNGQCGNVTTCAGSVFGSCCSEYYYCGNSIDFCGSGCRPAFGICGGTAPPPSSSSIPIPAPSSSTRSSTTSRPTSTLTPTPTSSAAPVPTNVSRDGRCGADGNGQTCTGSSFGRCCSSYGWCGDGQDDYCRLSWGCQPQFGTCS